MSFNLYANDNLYHLDFRVNYKDQKDTLVQSFEVKKQWQKSKQSNEPLNLRKGSNTVIVSLNSDFYRAQINGQLRKVSIDMKEEKLMNAYKKIVIGKSGGCIKINMEKSYVIWENAALADGEFTP
jgi:hypothetical protein